MVKCDVIQDLLPLYIDDVASEGSRLEVDDHIKTCSDCREVLFKMQTGGNPIRLSVDKAEIGAFKIMKQKLLHKNILIACASIVATIIIYGLFGYLYFMSMNFTSSSAIWIIITVNCLILLAITSSIVHIFYYNHKKTRKVKNAPISEAEALIKSKAQEFLSWYGPKCYATFEFINSSDIIRLRLPEAKYEALSEGEKGILRYQITDEKVVSYVDFLRN